MAPQQSTVFAGFISYSHVDEDVARWLHARLEAYEVPKPLRLKVPDSVTKSGRLGRFFRDIDELPAAMDLPQAIRDVLRRSKCLIVLCSPSAKASAWVAKEIDYFVSLDKARPVFLAIVDGDPLRDVPSIFQGSEPLVADLRPAKDGRELGFLKLVSGILGVGLGELRDREVEATRIRNRRRMIVVGILMTSLIGATAGLIGTVFYSKRSNSIAAEAIDASADLADETYVMTLEGDMNISANEQVIRSSLARLEALAKRGALPRELHRRRAWTYWRLSTLYQIAENWKEQLTYASKAVAATEGSPDYDDRVLHSLAILSLASATAETGNRRRSDALFSQNLKEAESLLADFPDRHQAKLAYAESVAGHARRQFQLGRAESAISSYSKACPLYAEVALEHSESTTDARLAAECFQRLGEQLYHSERFREAASALEKSAASARTNPKIDNAEKALILAALANLVPVYASLGQDEKALLAGIETVEIYTALARNPADANASDEKLRAAVSLLLDQTEADQKSSPVALLRAFDACTAALRDLHARTPDDDALERTLFSSLMSAGGLAADAGSNSAARERFLQAREVLADLKNTAPDDERLGQIGVVLDGYISAVEATPEGTQPDFGG